MSRRIRPLAATLLIAASLTACGGNTVGSASLFNKTPGGQAALGSDPSPSPSPTAVAQHTTPPTTAPQPTKAPPPPPTQKPQAARFDIGIYGDNSGQPQFNPPAARVFAGTTIVFTNHDSVARSVVSDGGAFDSGMIAPGGTWTYAASTPGTYNYHDGTRPYAVAYFQVVHQ